MNTESNETTTSKIIAESEKLESASPTSELEQPTPDLEQAAAPKRPARLH